MLAVAEYIVFGDVELLAIDTITSAFAPFAEVRGLPPGSTEIPNPRPDEFWRIFCTGGTQETIITDSVQLTFEGYALTRTRAQRICAIARAVLKAQDGALFGVAIFARPQNLPDPVTGLVRYTFSCSVRVRGSVLA